MSVPEHDPNIIHCTSPLFVTFVLGYSHFTIQCWYVSNFKYSMRSIADLVLIQKFLVKPLYFRDRFVRHTLGNKSIFILNQKGYRTGRSSNLENIVFYWKFSELVCFRMKISHVRKTEVTVKTFCECDCYFHSGRSLFIYLISSKYGRSG